ncbi:L,D-transpeptidase [Sphingopyxis sp.]|uniref:L,D-transpeptidase n=1 Tax=Sphingopyxis sp. TaxID=1908224 RepID=UPI002D779DC8|nr:L,D-transpeptidase family protein [Sphingopyxis sp.]HET6526064.1 L,D-transpeptidase family protein [Sphingopyxis sp.]
MRLGLIASLLFAAAAVGGFAIADDVFPVAIADRATGAIPMRPAQLALAGNSIREYLSPAERSRARQGGLLPAGTISLLRTSGQMRHGDYDWNEEGVPPGQITVWVDLRTQLLSVFRGGHEIGTAVIVYGADTMESPLGRFPILFKKRDYHSRSYDAPMPYSLFITDTGVALHGSPMSSRRATHGCIGLPTEFARLLFSSANTGDVVHIVRSGTKLAMAPRRR